MTDQRDKARTIPAETAADVAATAARVSVSRRALLRGASVAAPAVLTLNSNAAFGWAVASGTIGTRPANPYATGEATCLDTTGLIETKPGVYPAHPADLMQIADLEYRLGPLDQTTGEPTGTALNAEMVCQASEGGDPIYYFDGNQWQPVQGFGGAVVSVTLASAASFSVGDLPRYPV